jgi:PAS domain S-box-containing protein
MDTEDTSKGQMGIELFGLFHDNENANSGISVKSENIDNDESFTPVESITAVPDIEIKSVIERFVRDSADEQKIIDEELTESKEYMKQLFNDSHIPLIVIDAETGKYIDCNKAAVRIYGYSSRQEVLGKTPLDVSAPVQYDGSDSAIEAKNHIRICCEKGSHVFEWRHQRPDGQIWDADVHLMLLHCRGKPLIQFKLQDITERKGMEKALKDSEETLLSLINATNETLLLTDREGRILIANETLARRLGKRVRELIGTSQYDYFPSDVAKRRKEQFDKAVHTGKLIQFEDKRAEKYYDIYAYPVFDETGEVSKIAIFARDTTGRKLAEEELLRYRNHLEQLVAERTAKLEKSEIKYKNLVDNALVAVFQTNICGDILFSNDAFIRLFKHETPEQIASVNAKIVYKNPGDRKTFIKILKKSGKVNNFETIFLTREEEELNVLVSATLENDVISGMIMDITGLKKAENALRESKQLYQTFIDSTSDMVFLKDEGFRNIIVNNKLAAFLGGDESDIIGKSDFLLMSEEDAMNCLQTDRAALESQSIVISEQTIEDRIFETRKFPVILGKTKTGVGAFIRDITEQKTTENALRTQSINLQELNTALKVLLNQRNEDKKALEERLASNVKNLILPYLEKIKKSPLNPQQRSHMDILEANLNEIVSPFLHIIRQLNLSPREIQVASLIKEGKSTKEIATIMSVATSTIDSYRNSIRDKLDLNNKKINLQSYLQSIT